MHTIKKEKATTHHKNKDMTLSSYVVLKGFSHATTDALKKKQDVSGQIFVHRTQKKKFDYYQTREK